MERFKNAQVGDLVYCRMYGKGVIAQFSRNKEYPLCILFDVYKITDYANYTLDGKSDKDAVESILFYRDDSSNYLTERPK